MFADDHAGRISPACIESLNSGPYARATKKGSAHQQWNLYFGRCQATVIGAKALVEALGEDHLVRGGEYEATAQPGKGGFGRLGADEPGWVCHVAPSFVGEGFDGVVVGPYMDSTGVSGEAKLVEPRVAHDQFVRLGELDEAVIRRSDEGGVGG